MKRVFASLLVLGVSACQPPQPGDEAGDPITPPAAITSGTVIAGVPVAHEAAMPGISLDANWTRVGGPPPASREKLAEWLANHPRMAAMPAANMRAIRG
jgi:hypothetical protein